MNFLRGSAIVETALLIIGFMIHSGCAISEKVFVQDAVVTAPSSQLPIRLADNVVPGKLSITPSVSFGRKSSIAGRLSGHSNVNGQGYYAVDTIRSSESIELSPSGQNLLAFKGTNLHWTIPSMSAGLSLDFPVSRSFAFSGGISYAAGEGIDLWGGHVGIGMMSEGKVTGFRLDAGLQWTPTAYDIRSVVETEYDPLFSKNYIRSIFYRDQANGTGFGWYAGLTLNVRDSSWVVKPFGNVTIARQQLFSLYPEQRMALVPDLVAPSGLPDSKAEGVVTVLTLTPGIAIPLGDPGSRVLIGARWMLLPSLLNEDNASSSPSTMISPFIQIDIGL